MQSESTLEVPSVIKNLSPSAISKYIQCPRQYYYAEQLKLKNTQPTVKQVGGILLHQILEWRNQQKKNSLPEEGTLDDFHQAIDLLDKPALSVAKNTIAKTILAYLDLSLFNALLYIQKAQVKHALKLALENYFESLPQTSDPLMVIETELWLSKNIFHHNASIRLTGRADLLAKRDANRLLLVDYKANKAGFKADSHKNQLQLEQSLSTEPKWDEANLSQQFSKRDIQLPFYWWLLKTNPEYQHYKIDVALQFIRPKYQGGCQLLCLTDEFFEANHHTFEKIIQHYVLPEMTQDTVFRASGSASACRLCDYKSICERGYSINQEDGTSVEDEQE